MRLLHRIGTGALLLSAAFAVAAPAAAAEHVAPLGAGDGTPSGAVTWMRNHVGRTGWEGYCEKAVENAYGITGVWPSAFAHWHGVPGHRGARPPAGSFVYWRISAYGHVGIADGHGGFYSSSVHGAIGHRNTVRYFAHYLGWTPAGVPVR